MIINVPFSAFDNCLCPCNHVPSQATDYIHYSRNPPALSLPIPIPASTQVPSGMISTHAGWFCCVMEAFDHLMSPPSFTWNFLRFLKVLHQWMVCSSSLHCVDLHSLFIQTFEGLLFPAKWVVYSYLLQIKLLWAWQACAFCVQRAAALLISQQALWNSFSQQLLPH